ncbi:MAG: serine/threonine protein kinase [Planctomycetes bacterium]|nr:serine/threonine protein kinase [Planctomycetota bacterium]
MAEERQCNECGGKLPADAPEGMCPQCLMKLGLPSGAGAEKKDLSDDQNAIPTSATPPGRFVPPEPAELAKQFPQLEILELLGQGGMGAVYKARQKQLDRVVALKILPPEVGQTEAFAERFTREARSMAKLNHPRIVSVFDFGQTEDGLCYFIMEFVDGTDLRHVIQTGELGTDEALAIVPQVCEALQYAHEEGIVHRDIKPENILLDKKGRVKIADFGLAKLLDKPATAYTLTQIGQRMGTPHYMAPEQIEHPGQVDHRADIYSLGVVFYEMLTGQLPIGRFAPPSTKVQVDVRLDRVVLKTLEYEPERRYQHASEVKTDVEQISSGPEPPRPAVEAIQEVDIQAVRRKVRGPAIALLLAGLVNLLPLVVLPGLLIVSYLFRAPQPVNVLSGSINPTRIYEDVRGLETVKSGMPIGNIELLPKRSVSQTTVLSAMMVKPTWLIFGPLLLPILLMLPVAGITILGAWKMRKLELYGLAITASIVAMLPCTPGFIIGLPAGIWALMVLKQPDVKAAFRRKPGHRKPGIGPEPQEPEQQASEVKTDVKAIASEGQLSSPPQSHLERLLGFWMTPQPGFAKQVGIPTLTLLAVWMVAVVATLVVGQHTGVVLATGLVLLPVIFLFLTLRWAVRRGKARSTGQAQTPGGPASSAATSTVGRAWQQWWAERDKHTTKAIKTVLAVVYFFCLLAFFGFSGSGSASEGTFKHEIGFPSPWFTIEKHESGHNAVVHLSSAWIVAGIGFLVYYMYWRIKRTEGIVGKLDSPRGQLIIWAVLAVIAMSIGFVPLVMATIKGSQ